jgi:hypothetical protein
MLSYYGGERASAYLAMSLSSVAITSGAVLVTRDTDFMRGLGWTLIGLGGLELIGGITYVVRVHSEIRHYGDVLARDPAAFRTEEIDHIRGTTSRFFYYRLAELVFTLAGAGIAVYGFAANQDLWKGIGIGVASIWLPFLVIDTVNNTRAQRYDAQVHRFDPAMSLQLLDRGAGLSLGGRF